MNIYVPSYYQKFRCIADRCRHSCCVGWEIDIDETTLAYYNELDGKIGDTIRNSITGKVPHFRLTQDKKCPHLNQNGLCNIITEIGEDALCDICYDHPRFRNFYSDFVEIGLGLTCEAASELILKSNEVFELVPLDDRKEQKITNLERFVLDERTRLIDIMTDRKRSISSRMNDLFSVAQTEAFSFDITKWCGYMLSLERLDESWTLLLEKCKNSDMQEFDTIDDNSCLSIPLEQLMVYFMYRHLPSAIDDGQIIPRIRFCLLSSYIVYTLTVMEKNKNSKSITDIFVDIARMYSSEIEYSDENLDLIIKKLS